LTAEITTALPHGRPPSEQDCNQRRVSWALPWGVTVIGTMSNSYFIDRRVKDGG
jgi:hypothetical protein